jgi:hypothetical protein
VLLALAAAVACEPADSGRWRNESFCQGELARDEHEILDDARRPPMRNLGPEALRFSYAPSLGGDGLVIEIVPRGRSPAMAKVIGLYGHPTLGWSIEDRLNFTMAPSAYRRLAARIDAQLAKPVTNQVEFVDGQEIILACADGAGFLTERSVGERTFNLAGSCGLHHPNHEIARAMFGLLCPHLGADFPELRVLKGVCRSSRQKRR